MGIDKLIELKSGKDPTDQSGDQSEDARTLPLFFFSVVKVLGLENNCHWGQD